MKTIWQAMQYMIGSAVGYGLIIGAVYGTFMLFPFVGTFFGLIIGGSIGLFSGILTGCIVHLLSSRENKTQINKVFWLVALTLSCASFSLMFGIPMLYYVKRYAVTPVSIGIGHILFWLPTLTGSVVLFKLSFRFLREEHHQSNRS